MSHSRITSRYAKSLLNLSISENCIDRIKDDMNLLSSLCKNKDLRLLLKSPIIQSDKKSIIINKIFNDKLNKVSLKFINIIIKKRREGYLQGIAESFIIQYRLYKNIKSAVIKTPYELDLDSRNLILDFISTKDGSKVEIEELIDPNLIGGAIITIEDKQLDISVSSKIKELKKSFSKNLYIKDY